MSNIINHWEPGTLPYSWNPKNVKQSWSGTDQVRNADPNWNQGYISYDYNAHGFRTHDLASLQGQEVDVALGCSFTEGIGLPVEYVWPSVIEQRTARPMLNMGLSGGATDTVARILTNISPLYKINTVYILWPLKHRFEIYENNSICTMYPGSASASIEYTWYMGTEYSSQRFYKHHAITKHLAQLYHFQIKEYIMPYDLWQIPGDLARDQLHAGVQSHQNLASMFLGS
jgi:hypothetical protein